MLNKPSPGARPLQRLVMPRPIKVRAIQTMQSDGKQGWTAFERIRLGVSAYIVPADEYRRLKRIEKAAELFDQAWWVPTAHLEGDELALRKALKPVKRHNEKVNDGGETK